MRATAIERLFTAASGIEMKFIFAAVNMMDFYHWKKR
jgi:hypothetical protein